MSALALGGALVCSPLAGWAQNYHFRGASIAWEPTPTPGQVVFHITYAARLSQSSVPATTNAIGGTYPTGEYFFVDYQNNPFAEAPLQVKVVAVNFNEDWYEGTADIANTYFGAGPYLAGIFGANFFQTGNGRILNLYNRSGANYVVQTSVSPTTGNHSPTNSLPLVVYIPQSASNTFAVPATDPDGDRVRWRLSTDAEAGGGPSPPNLTVNPTNGVVTWNDAGLTLGNYTAQVVIEDLDSKGNVQTQNPVDFVLTLVSNTVPSVIASPTNVFNTAPGVAVTFLVTGTNADLGDNVTLTAGGLPATALLSPALPQTGAASVGSTFFWTPGFADLGTHTVTFTATDSTGLQSSTTVTINVVDSHPPIVVTLPPPVQTQAVAPSGTAVSLLANVTNLYGLPTTVQWSVDGTNVQSSSVTPVSGSSLVAPSAQVTNTFGYVLGQHTVSVTAADGIHAPATTLTFVTIVDTTPPTILSCPANQAVTLPTNGAGVTIPNLTGQVVATDNGTPASQLVISQIPLPGAVFFQPGPLPITFTVTDLSGNSSQCQTVWVLVDDSVPRVYSSVVTTNLWPPNHDLVCVGFGYHVNKTVASQGIQVFSNEADIPSDTHDAAGDDRFSPDATDLQNGEVVLRSERLGGGPGRVYLIVVTVTDALGQVAASDQTVVVPASQSAANVALVNTLAAQADAYFKTNGVPPLNFVPVGIGGLVGPKQTSGPCPVAPQ
ncbi:MAG: HYR domain-containing protein [Verrucomicrobia bacterium]|nr:HYR domain-containing protein [Verrucomicrobiota bacterium]